MRRDLEPFRFKRFAVEHGQATLAVGTDAVLLGAWVYLASNSRILEVGTGCGVISLCLAQRFLDVHIHALDIDQESVLEASHNFRNSTWSNRLVASCEPYSEHSKPKYDVVVSNPPYFRDASKNPERHRELARHQDEFGFEAFVSYCTNQTTQNGKVSLVYPAEDLDYVKTIFESQNWFLTRLTTVFGKRSKPASRVLIEFSKRESSLASDELVIYHPDHSYTAEYQELTKDFYLNF